MSANVRPVPEGFTAVTPHLTLKDAASAIDFYKEAFGALELFRNVMEETGQIMHAQICIDDSIVMLNDEMPAMGVVGPSEDRPATVTVHLYVKDVDARFEQAVKAGATPIMPVEDTFWGDRYGILVDPFGHRWSVATRTEDVPFDELGERAKQAFGGGESA